MTPRCVDAIKVKNLVYFMEVKRVVNGRCSKLKFKTKIKYTFFPKVVSVILGDCLPVKYVVGRLYQQQKTITTFVLPLDNV